MKLSVITVCCNSIETIELTIRSVLSQVDIDIEYLIVDGASRDGTLEIIGRYALQYPGTIRYVSGPDSGMYDAMNKGIKMAAGDVIGILNSDDVYASNRVLSRVDKIMTEERADSCYGNLLYVKNGKPRRYWRSGNRKPFRWGWMPPHPAFFVKKDVYETYGLFRQDCGINGDYELMLRFLDRYRISTVWVDKVFVHMDSGGRSNNGLRSRINGIRDDRIAWKVNGMSPFFFTLFLKKIQKIPQFIRAGFYHV